MFRTAFAALSLLAVSCPAYASTPAPAKERAVDTAVHACQPATPADASRIAWTHFAAHNASAAPAKVICGATIDVGRPGTTAFGAKLLNTSGRTATVTCTGWIGRGDNDGAYSITRSVMVSPNQQARIEWGASDIGRRTLDGGQAGFLCTLPPGLRLRWVYTVGVDN